MMKKTYVKPEVMVSTKNVSDLAPAINAADFVVIVTAGAIVVGSILAKWC